MEWLILGKYNNTTLFYNGKQDHFTGVSAVLTTSFTDSETPGIGEMHHYSFKYQIMQSEIGMDLLEKMGLEVEI